jgi:rifampicin phosphotransferase
MLGDRWIVDRIPTENFPNYTRGNAGEVLADPVSPLGWTYAWESGIVLGCRDGFVEMGVFDLDEYDPSFPESFGLFGGYFYNSLTQARLFGVRSGAGWQAIDNAYFDDPSAVPPYIEKPWHISPRHTEALGKVMGWFMSTPNVPSIERQKVDAKAIRDSRPDLSAMTTQQLLGRARSIQPHLIPMFASHVKASLGASVGPGILAALTAEIDPTMVGTLLAGIGGVDSAEIANAIWSLSRTVRASNELTALFDAGLTGLADRLNAEATKEAATNSASDSATNSASYSAKFAADVAGFFYEYGARGPNEWDLYSESYETRPALLFSAVDRLRGNDDSADPKAGEARGAAEREKRGAELAAMLAGNEEAAGMLAAGLSSARVFMAARERCKTNNIRTLHEIRMCFNELGRRLVADGTLTDARLIYMLTETELDEFFANPTASNALTASLAERYSEYLSLYDLAPPYIVDVTAPPLSSWTRKDAALVESVAVGDVLKGIAGSPGIATGTAKVLLTVDDPTELEEGDILIAPNTDPAWTPLFLAAAAVVVNVGAVGTHAVIVSRELGIPCVPSIADATRRIPSGATITVDGSAGTVTIVALP